MASNTELVLGILRNHNHIKGAEIAKLLDLSCNTIDVRQAINNLRRGGIPVCADCDGYYIPDEAEPIIRQIDSLNNRICAMRSAVSGLETALRKLERWKKI